jgi:hypothetical protein
MIMVADVLPGLKRCLRSLGLGEVARMMVARMIAGFVGHTGRMSGLQAAGSIRSQSRHRAQIGRFLGRKRWRGERLNARLRQLVLAMFPSRGLFVFIVDATLCSQQGKKTENTYTTGNRQRRPQKGRRYNRKKNASKSVHSFTMGLLVTPTGMRIPFQRAHQTKAYCQAKGLTHRTSAEFAAEMIDELPVPDGTRVIVLGDTAYDAAVVRDACATRGFTWIVPCNPERVLSGSQPRPKVRSLVQDLSSVSLRKIRFAPGQGPFVVYRRLSAQRVGPKAKPRTFYVHQERREVQSIGPVRLVFSTKKPTLQNAKLDDVKILLTNDETLNLKEIIELYSLRWQVELFFKELKSTLGFHHYRFQRFACVEAWVEMALTTFQYLEWYRAVQLTRRGLSEKDKLWWRAQRTYGLCQAVRQASQHAELKYLAERLETVGGLQKLKRLILASFPSEYRPAL